MTSGMAAWRISSAGFIPFRALLFLIVSLFSTFAEAQEPFLALGRTGKGHQVIFYEGDELRFRLKGEKHFIEDHILGLKGNTLRFHYFEIQTTDIEAVDIRGRKKSFFSLGSLSGKLIFAGVAFIGIDQVNQVFIRDEPAGVSSTVAIVSASLVGGGILAGLLDKRYFKTGKKNYIQIIDERGRSSF